jgi:hypothetical protein
MQYFIVFYEGNSRGTQKLGMPSNPKGSFIVIEPVYPSNSKTCEQIEKAKNLADVAITGINSVTQEQANAFTRG